MRKLAKMGCRIWADIESPRVNNFETFPVDLIDRIRVEPVHYLDDYDCSHLLLMNESKRPFVIVATKEIQSRQVEPEDDKLQAVFMSTRDTGLFELEQWIKQKLSLGGQYGHIHYRDKTEQQQRKGEENSVMFFD